MSVEDSESRRFELNIWLSFSQADLGPTSGQELLLFFFSSLELFFVEICAHSERYSDLVVGLYESQSFSWQRRVSMSIGL